MDTRNEGKPSPTDDEWGAEPFAEVVRKKHRTDGARLALEAAVEWLRAHGHHDLAASMSGDVMLAGALTPEDIVREAEAKGVRDA